MTDLNNRKEKNKQYQFWIYAASLSGVVLSIAVIIGWVLNLPLLVTVFPGASAMKLNTAIYIFILSVGVAIMQKIKATNTSLKNHKWTLGAIASILIFIGITSLIQNYFPSNLIIDELLIKDLLTEQNEGIFPNRISVLTAASFVFFGIAFLFFLTSWKYRYKLIEAMLIPVMLIAVTALVSFAYGIPEHSKILFISTMPIRTATLLFILSVASLFIHQNSALISLLTGKGTGNTMARKVMLRITVFALCFGFTRIHVFRYFKADEEFSIVLSLMVYIIISGFVVWFTATEVNEIEAKRNEAELDANLMQLFIKEAPSAIAVLDTKLRYIAHSQNWVNDYNLQGIELVGKSHYEIFPEIGEEWKSIHQRCLLGETIRRDEDKFVRADNTVQWLKWETRPWYKTDGDIGGVLMFTMDISEQKAAAAAREKFLELEAKNRELEQFTYIASHDLQEPLKTISNFSKLLNEQYSNNLDESGKQILSYVAESAQRMTELVKGLLFYARIGSERKLEQVDFNEVLHNVCQDLTSAIKEKQAHINFASLPVLPAYKMEINQLFQNLISNAIKFCDKSKQPIIQITAHQAGKGWAFSVQDNGIGIPAKDREKAFVLFKQLHNRGVYEGTGIGLAYCKKIVELHGGNILITDAPNGGSVFQFINPIQYEKA
jgi:PAS domain S-box-containing protein